VSAPGVVNRDIREIFAAFTAQVGGINESGTGRREFANKNIYVGTPFPGRLIGVNGGKIIRLSLPDQVGAVVGIYRHLNIPFSTIGTSQVGGIFETDVFCEKKSGKKTDNAEKTTKLFHFLLLVIN
jgi:hypothetical protein